MNSDKSSSESSVQGVNVSVGVFCDFPCEIDVVESSGVCIVGSVGSVGEVKENINNEKKNESKNENKEESKNENREESKNKENMQTEQTKKMDRSEYYKKWYNENKEQHKSYLLEKIACECGKQVCRNSMRTHKKSSLHQKAMEKLKNEIKDKPEYDQEKNFERNQNLDTNVIMSEIKKLESILMELKTKLN
jgi:hypothetical protein